jgi:hypothetical protein
LSRGAADEYLVTAEFFLRYLRDHLGELASTVLHVEPPTLAPRGAAADDDIVDFEIEVAGDVTTTVHVKGSASASCNELLAVCPVAPSVR